jgi:hypothetical protein
MSTTNRQPKLKPGMCPAMTFEEARRVHLHDFASATPEQKVEWLGQMLELMSWAYDARTKDSPIHK